MNFRIVTCMKNRIRADRTSEDTISVCSPQLEIQNVASRLFDVISRSPAPNQTTFCHLRPSFHGKEPRGRGETLKASFFLSLQKNTLPCGAGPQAVDFRICHRVVGKLGVADVDVLSMSESCFRRGGLPLFESLLRCLPAACLRGRARCERPSVRRQRIHRMAAVAKHLPRV